MHLTHTTYKNIKRIVTNRFRGEKCSLCKLVYCLSFNLTFLLCQKKTYCFIPSNLSWRKFLIFFFKNKFFFGGRLHQTSTKKDPDFSVLHQNNIFYSKISNLHERSGISWIERKIKFPIFIFRVMVIFVSTEGQLILSAEVHSMQCTHCRGAFYTVRESGIQDCLSSSRIPPKNGLTSNKLI